MVSRHDDDLLTVRETVDYLGVTERWLQRRRSVGDGPAFVRLAGTRGGVRYRRGDLSRWLDSRVCRSTTDEQAESHTVEPGDGA
jgi:predicted DNA-binding transcriptional regulator AlpA